MRSHHFEPGTARFAPTLCSVPRPTWPGSGLAAACAGAFVLLAPQPRALADDLTLPPISVGAGVRTSFEYNDPTVGKKTDDFNLDSIRLYISGHVMDHISFMFNTEYEGSPIKQFNARISLYYLDVKYDHDVAGIDHKVVRLGLQLQM
jgi:hypothetical protein